MLTKIDDFFTFEGYKGAKETNEKKITRDVIKKGDKYFNTGDLMMIDKNGYVFFCDRLGDTFRYVSCKFFSLSVSTTFYVM